MATCWRAAPATPMCSRPRASSPATVSRRRWKNRPRRCSSISARCAPAPPSCRSTPPTRKPSSNISSATPGRSKGAMLTHANLASNALTLARYWRFSEDDVLLHALPIYHTHGLFVATNTILFSGASMIFMAKLDPDELLRHIPRATVMMGVPTVYTRLLRHPGLTGEATRHMRLFVSGSAPLLAETHREWQERTGHAILERYGMTETNMNTSNPYIGERIAGTVGYPLPGVTLRIAEPETGKALSKGSIGVIEVKGPNVFS